MNRFVWVAWATGLGLASCSGGGGTGPSPDAAAIIDGGAPSLDAPSDGSLEIITDANLTPDLAATASADAPTADLAPNPDVPPEVAAPAALTIDKTAFIFGPTPFFCESEVPATLSVANAGGTETTALEVGLEGAFPDRFRLEKDGCAGKFLAPGASCVVLVRFVPKQLMEQAASAQLVVKGAAGERATVVLSGDSNLTHFDVFPFMSGVLEFQTVKVGAASPTLEDTWTNNTDFPTMPSTPALVGADATDFLVVTNTCSGKVIGARQSCRVGVQMKPAAPGQRFAMLTMSGTGACGYEFGDSLALVGVGE